MNLEIVHYILIGVCGIFLFLSYRIWKLTA